MAIFPFTPSQTAVPPFQFQPILGGVTYNATTTWNIFGQRWYLNIFALNGTLLMSRAIVGSPDGIALQGITFDVDEAEAVMESPHGFQIGTQVALTISGCSPDGYNGNVLAAVNGPSSFTYPLAADPGQATALGNATYNINLAGGYFPGSLLVFRESAQQFEVTP